MYQRVKKNLKDKKLYSNKWSYIISDVHRTLHKQVYFPILYDIGEFTDDKNMTIIKIIFPIKHIEIFVMLINFYNRRIYKITIYT